MNTERDYKLGDWLKREKFKKAIVYTFSYLMQFSENTVMMKNGIVGISCLNQYNI